MSLRLTMKIHVAYVYVYWLFNSDVFFAHLALERKVTKQPTEPSYEL